LYSLRGAEAPLFHGAACGGSDEGGYFGAKAPVFFIFYAALKRRSSTVLPAAGQTEAGISGLKPGFFYFLRGAEAPLFHGAACGGSDGGGYFGAKARVFLLFTRR
jgi:hypothetical protein